LHPSSDQAYAFLGRAYLSMGNRDAAREHLEKALELNPDNAFARRVLSLLANGLLPRRSEVQHSYKAAADHGSQTAIVPGSLQQFFLRSTMQPGPDYVVF
jgi:Tfp pilus assembly protein PilF